MILYTRLLTQIKICLRHSHPPTPLCCEAVMPGEVGAWHTHADTFIVGRHRGTWLRGCLTCKHINHVVTYLNIVKSSHWSEDNNSSLIFLLIKWLFSTILTLNLKIRAQTINVFSLEFFHCECNKFYTFYQFVYQLDPYLSFKNILVTA